MLLQRSTDLSATCRASHGAGTSALRWRVGDRGAPRLMPASRASALAAAAQGHAGACWPSAAPPGTLRSSLPHGAQGQR